MAGIVFLPDAIAIAQINHWSMENLVNDSFREDFNLLLLLPAEAVKILLDLILADGFELIAQVLDRRGNFQRSIPCVELKKLIEDDVLYFRNLGPAVCHVVIDDVIQAVNIMQKYIIDLVGGRIDIPRHSKIDYEERSVSSHSHYVSEIGRVQQVRIRLD